MVKSDFFKNCKRSAKTIAHPNSRKTARVIKENIRKTARLHSKNQGEIKRHLLGEKLLWFQNNLPEGVDVVTPEILGELCVKYINRFEDELEQIRFKHSLEHRKRQHASREDIIKMTISRETDDFKSSGIQMVDIIQPEQLKLFKEWEGDIPGMNRFVIRGISMTYLKNCKTQEHSKSEMESGESSKEKGDNAEEKDTQGSDNSDSENYKSLEENEDASESDDNME